MNERWIGSILLALVGCESTGALGNRMVVIESRTVPAFTQVSSNAAVRVVLAEDAEVTEEVELQVEAESNLMEWIVTEVTDGTLVVDAGDARPNEEIWVRGATDLGSIAAAEADNGSQIDIEGTHVPTLTLESYNGSTVNVSGLPSASIAMTAHDNSQVNAALLSSGTATVDVVGGAEVDLCTTDRVTGQVSAEGKLFVRCGADVSGVETSSEGIVFEL